MANRLKMAEVQSILLLHSQGWSRRRIARELCVDRETVSRYVQLDQQSAAGDRLDGGISKSANAPISGPGSTVTFTGGNVVRLDASVETTNNLASWDNVDYYEEGGFKMDFLPNSAGGFSTHVGNYYGAGNDVIHSHWATGDFGTVTSVEITKIGGGTFDLNYFILTSNTDTGGGAASGLEQAYIEGFNSNVSTGAGVLLPSEDWGFPAAPIYLGSAFDVVDKVVFTVTTSVDCFGMDEFYIDQPAPSKVPEPASICLLLCAIGLITVWKRGGNRR